MSIPTKSSNAKAFDCAAAKNSLRELKPRERKQIEGNFADVYPDVEDAIKRGVSIAAILSALKDKGMILSAVRFKALRAAEAVRRADNQTTNMEESA